VSFEIQGMRELRAALLALPDEMTVEATAIVQHHAKEAMREIVTDYPEVSGNLKRNVSYDDQSRSNVSARAVIRSKAFHVWMYEHGTKERRTSKGWRRGAAKAARPPQQAVPAAISHRQRMVAALIALVRRAGFEVTERND